MVTTFYPPYNFGGDGIFVERLSKALARRGHRIDVVHCVDAHRLSGKRVATTGISADKNINVYPLKSAAGPFSPLFTQQTARTSFKRKEIQALIQKNQYDVIHYHNMSLIGLEALQIGEAIKLYTTHEHWLICPMHVLWKHDTAPCEKPACISCQLRGRRPIQFWRYGGYMQQMLSHVDRFISPSHFTIEKHREFGCDIPFVHIPLFLSSEIENLEINEIESDEDGKPYFLYVGRLEKIKGVQALISAFRKYRNCNLLIAGDGNYSRTLKQQAQGLDHIRFLGRIDFQRLRGYYRNAIAVIVPSLCFEVSGTIQMEAFLEKTPVIVHNIGALNEVVEFSGGGLIYQNQEELIHHMETFRKLPEIRDEYGRKGYQAYCGHYSEDRHIQQYYQLIMEIADGSPKAAPVMEVLREEAKSI